MRKIKIQEQNAFLLHTISEIYEQILYPAAQECQIKLKTKPNNKFTVLIAGDQSTGKSSFINDFLGIELLKTGINRTTQNIQFVLQDNLQGEYIYSQGKQFIPQFQELIESAGVEQVVTIHTYQQGQRMQQIEEELQQSHMLASISKVFNKDWTICADETQQGEQEAAQNPFVFVDSPGINQNIQPSVQLAIKQISKQADIILLFIDENCNSQINEYLDYLKQNKLIDKVQLVLTKIDKYSKPTEFVKANEHLTQSICRLNKIYDKSILQICLDKFVTQKQNQIMEPYRKQKLLEEFRKRQEISATLNGIEENNESEYNSSTRNNGIQTKSVTFAQSLSDNDCTTMEQQITANLNFIKESDQPIVWCKYFNQLNDVREYIIKEFSYVLMVNIEHLEKDVQIIYNELNVMKIKAKNERSSNMKRVFVIIILSIIMSYLLGVLFYDKFQQLIPDTYQLFTNKVFLSQKPILQSTDGKRIIALTCIIIFLTGIILQQTMKPVQLQEIDDLLYVFDNDIIPKMQLLNQIKEE